MSVFSGKQFKKSKPVNSLNQYIDLVEEAKKLLGSNELWYRGLASYKYKLIPNIYRLEYDEQLERNLTFSFKDKAKGFINWRDLNDFDWYFLMQHYGLRTRLLDWTEGSLIALFFSLKLGPKDNPLYNPVIWMMDPLILNELTISKREIIRTEDNPQNPNYFLAKKYLEMNFEKSSNPISISSSYTNERIIRQKGCFTMHGNQKKDILSVFRTNKCDKIASIQVNKNSRDRIIQELITSGISESTLFPDLEGLSREINFKYSV